MTNHISSDFSVEEENSLTHYGVLGMKWGRRKQRPTSGKRKKSSKSKRSFTEPLRREFKQGFKKQFAESLAIYGAGGLGYVSGGVGLGMAASAATAYLIHRGKKKQQKTNTVKKQVSNTPVSTIGLYKIGGKNGFYATLTEEEAKMGGWSNNRVTGKEESNFWKDYAKQQLKKQGR